MMRFLALASGGFEETVGDPVISETASSAGALDTPAHTSAKAEGGLSVVLVGTLGSGSR